MGVQVGSLAGEGQWRSSLDETREAQPATSEGSRSEHTDNSFTFNRLLQGPIITHQPRLPLEVQSSDEATPTFGAPRSSYSSRSWQLHRPQPVFSTSPQRSPLQTERINEGDESQEDTQESPFASAAQQSP